HSAPSALHVLPQVDGVLADALWGRAYRKNEGRGRRFLGRLDGHVRGDLSGRSGIRLLQRSAGRCHQGPCDRDYREERRREDRDTGDRRWYRGSVGYRPERTKGNMGPHRLQLYGHLVIVSAAWKGEV